MDKDILAIIPARGGSKGLPGKNIKKLSGKPLIEYTIDAAKKSKHITRVVVSTDDKEIAKISMQCGAEIPCLRPKELSTDKATSVDAILHMLQYLKETEDYSPEYVILLQPTSPLRTNIHIDEAINKLINSDYDSLISVCEAEVNPYWTNVFQGDNLKYFIEDGKKITRRQDLPSVYRMNGAIYLIKAKSLKEYKTFEIDNMTGYIMDSESSVDIDTYIDFKIAELMMINRGK